MKGFDKLHIKSAVKGRSKMNLAQTHLTTLDFGQLVPLYHRSLLPGDKFTINGDYFCRTAPIVKPTYGKFSFKTVSCFVPFNMVAYDAEAWLAGMTAFQGTIPYFRYITYGTLVDFFLNANITNTVTVNDAYDFTLVLSNGNRSYKRFTNYGRYCYKVLTSLGYAIPTNIDLQTSSTWYTKFYATKLNAMPIICYFKAFADLFYLSSRANSNIVVEALRCIKYDINTTTLGYSNTTHCILNNFLINCFALCHICYENDYFTSAWESPESITSVAQHLTQVDVEAIPGDATKFDASKGTYSVRGNSATIYQRTLDLMRSFYNWVKRNNYSGSREVQEIFSRMGIKTDDFKSHYTHILSFKENPLNVGDVTAQAQSTNVPLGDYAGKGIMSGNDSFHFESNDYGMLFIFGYFTVSPMMSYGFEREVLKNSPLEFYNPEFDGVGVDAISYGEVFANPIPDTTDTTLDDTVFGFTERYNDYRYGRDQITGDFRRYRNLSPDNVWHSGRLLNDVRKNGNMIAQGLSMCQLDNHDSEYNRIFSVTNGDVDHFLMTAHFKVSAVRPMLSLNQAPGLGEGDTVISRNGNEVN